MKLYMLYEPWQSKKPIKIRDNLHLSLEEDLVTYDMFTKEITDVLETYYPEILLKLGGSLEGVELRLL